MSLIIEFLLKLPKTLDLECDISDLILEGGALEFNGAGLALSTEPCLLGHSRNPDQSLEEIKTEIKRALNLEEVFVFSQGLLEDHTDGHIDNIVRFIDKQTILVVEAEKGDPQYEVTKLLESELQLLQQSHPNYRIHKIPLPKSQFYRGEILSRSYLNFIFVNGAMIVPVFHEPTDKLALEIIQSFVPNRKVIGFDCRELVLEGGGLHCMTCHQPLLCA